jgi:hypothetical protein
MKCPCAGTTRGPDDNWARKRAGAGASWGRIDIHGFRKSACFWYWHSANKTATKPNPSALRVKVRDLTSASNIVKPALLCRHVPIMIAVDVMPKIAI